MEWWNTNGNKFKTPSEHLFKLLDIKPTVTNQKFMVGNGVVYLVRQNPKEFVMESNSSREYLSLLEQAYEKDARAGKLLLKNNLYLERGPYDIVSVMDESIDNQPYIINGPVIDLFDPELPVLSKKTVHPGQQAFLYNLSRAGEKMPKVLASASRIYDENVKGNSYSFLSKSPLNTLNSTRVLLPSAPKETIVTDSKGHPISDVKTSWDSLSATYYLSFENNPDGIQVKLIW
jgi:hypothetical protein